MYMYVAFGVPVQYALELDGIFEIFQADGKELYNYLYIVHVRTCILSVLNSFLPVYIDIH